MIELKQYRIELSIFGINLSGKNITFCILLEKLNENAHFLRNKMKVLGDST